MAIRFDEDDARVMGRDTAGVKGIELADTDEVVGVVRCPQSDADHLHALLTVTSNGNLFLYTGASGGSTVWTTNTAGSMVAARLSVQQVRVCGMEGMRPICICDMLGVSQCLCVASAVATSLSNQ